MIFNIENTEDLSRRERERLFKKNEILYAATKLIADNGYENTTIDLIAEASEFGKGTIYNYFQSKEEIYIAILTEIFTEYEKVIKEIDTETKTFKEFVKNLTDALFEFCTSNHNAFLIMVRLQTKDMNEKWLTSSTDIKSRHDGIVDICKNKISAAIKSKEIKNVDPASLFILYRSMIFPFIYNQLYYNKEKQSDLKQEKELVLSILFDGLFNKQ